MGEAQTCEQVDADGVVVVVLDRCCDERSAIAEDHGRERPKPSASNSWTLRALSVRPFFADLIEPKKAGGQVPPVAGTRGSARRRASANKPATWSSGRSSTRRPARRAPRSCMPSYVSTVGDSISDAEQPVRREPALHRAAVNPKLPRKGRRVPDLQLPGCRGFGATNPATSFRQSDDRSAGV